MYPDYYEIIKRPVSLDEVKAKVDREAYPKLSELQNDIETCFRNAKKYNVRDSVIWKDAKVLHVSVAQQWSLFSHSRSRCAETVEQGDFEA